MLSLQIAATGTQKNRYRQNGDSMARPRTPTALLELRGAFKNHPSRLKARKYEPIVTSALPDPPHTLPKPVKAAWLEMCERGFV
jgi:hypothetical protein